MYVTIAIVAAICGYFLHSLQHYLTAGNIIGNKKFFVAEESAESAWLRVRSGLGLPVHRVVDKTKCLLHYHRNKIIAIEFPRGAGATITFSTNNSDIIVRCSRSNKVHRGKPRYHEIGSDDIWFTDTELSLGPISETECAVRKSALYDHRSLHISGNDAIRIGRAARCWLGLRELRRKISSPARPVAQKIVEPAPMEEVYNDRMEALARELWEESQARAGKTDDI